MKDLVVKCLDCGITSNYYHSSSDCIKLLLNSVNHLEKQSKELKQEIEKLKKELNLYRREI